MKKKKMPATRESVLYLLVGLLLGTMCMMNSFYWNAPVPKEDALVVKGVYLSHFEQFSRGHSSGVRLRISGQEPFEIFGGCMDNRLREKLDDLEPGTVLSILVHPNSNAVLELAAEEEVLLPFSRVHAQLTSSQDGGLIFVLVCYSISMYGFCILTKLWRSSYSKHRRNRK